MIDDFCCSQRVPEEVYARHVEAFKSGIEAALVQRVEADYKQKLRDEVAKLTRMSGRDRELVACKVEIEENILTNRCPRCKTAFLDFDGCFAVTCAACGCGFCAWCLAD